MVILSHLLLLYTLLICNVVLLFLHDAFLLCWFVGILLVGLVLFPFVPYIASTLTPLLNLLPSGHLNFLLLPDPFLPAHNLLLDPQRNHPNPGLFLRPIHFMELLGHPYSE